MRSSISVMPASRPFEPSSKVARAGQHLQALRAVLVGELLAAALVVLQAVVRPRPGSHVPQGARPRRT
jgi:hypothetical protein